MRANILGQSDFRGQLHNKTTIRIGTLNGISELLQNSVRKYL